MKQLVKFNCFLVSILFYSCNITQPTEKIITEAQPVLLLSSFKSAIKQHGFCANTLVQTPFGYKAIKELMQNDIVMDRNEKEKKIIAITKHCVNQYIKLIVNDTIIYTGYDQLYYKFPDILVTAQEIKANDMLLNYTNEIYSIAHAELVHENELLYYLTVEGHTFCITPHGLCVHNSEALIVGTSSLFLSNIAIINPVIATIGATIALSTITHKAYQAYTERYSNNDQEIILPIDIICAERFYYMQRLTALEEMKQEFLCIKNGLKNIKFLCGTTSTNFTYQFLQENSSQNIYNQNQLLKISAKDESLLSDKQKDNLRILREFELEHLEQEIIHLQCALALHVDELIQQIDDACDEYNKAQEQISNAATLWNNNHNNMTYTIALQLYKANLLQKHLLANFNQKFNELKMVAQYYANSANIACIKQSTNIIEILEKLPPIIIEYDQRIATEKTCIINNIGIIEEHFAYQKILISHIKDGIINELAKSRNGRNVQAIAETKNKLVKLVAASNPNKNNKKNNDDEDDNDNNEQPFGKYEDASYHHKNSTGIKSISPTNGQNALNHSIASPNQNSKRRYGVSQSGQYVVFDETSPRLYHGHVIEWNELNKVKGLQKELIQQGMASKLGKAIYKIAKKITKKVIP